MTTNTVVATLRRESESQLQSFDDFADVVLLKLQFEIDDIQHLIEDKSVHLVKLAKFFKKILFISKDLGLSERIYNALKPANRLYTVAYSLNDTVIKEDNEYDYLQLPKDFSSKFLISPPHTPRYGDFNPLLLEESPVEIKKYHEEMLSNGIESGNNTIVLLSGSDAGVKITVTDCSDENDKAQAGQSSIKKANSSMPPRSIFEDIED